MVSEMEQASDSMPFVVHEACIPQHYHSSTLIGAMLTFRIMNRKPVFMVESCLADCKASDLAAILAVSLDHQHNG